MNHDLSGQKIGPYLLLDVIGRGGMAVVYRARHPHVQRDVAIKIIAADYARHRTFLQQFEREIQMAARLQHPYIVPVLDMGVENGQPYLVTAYLPGGTLAHHIAARPGGLSLEDVVCITAQVASALDYAHQLGVIHRDLKPGNVFIDERGNAYLGDFGIAQLISEAEQETNPAPGTYEYMAPELAEGHPASPASDIYALGVMIFEMLAGRRPFPFLMRDRNQLAEVHEDASVPDVQLWRPDLPPGVRVVVQQALSHDPAGRPPHAVALALSLARAAGVEMPICSAELNGQEHSLANMLADQRHVKTQPSLPTERTLPAIELELAGNGKETRAIPTRVRVPAETFTSAPSPTAVVTWLVFGMLLLTLIVLFVLIMTSLGNPPPR